MQTAAHSQFIMATKIEFIPFTKWPQSHHCYMLKFENVKILLDCGWNFQMDPLELEAVSTISKEIDAVLLTSADINFIGAYPYLYGNYDLTCPVYATYPVSKMGHLSLYDFYQSAFESKKVSINLDQIDAAFKNILQVKYSQKIYLKGCGFTVCVSCYQSGVTVGGCVWYIEIDGGDSRILYAPTINHQNDRHLSAIIIDSFINPTIFITSSESFRRKSIKKIFSETIIKEALIYISQHGGNLLLITDASGRCLEIILLLAELYESGICGNLNFYFVNHVSNHVVEAAKSQLEWMNEDLLKNFQLDPVNPFKLKFIKAVHSVDEVETSMNTVYIISNMCLESGIGLEFLHKYSSQTSNKIIFTTDCKNFDNLYKFQSHMPAFDVCVSRRVLNDQPDYVESIVDNSHNTLSNEISDEDVVEFDNKPIFSKLEKPKVMFEHRVSSVTWDAFGQVINGDDFLKHLVKPNNKISYNKVNDRRAAQNIKIDIDKFNHFFVENILNFQIRSPIQNAFLDGLCDSDSLFRLIKVINPENLILINHEDADTDKLAHKLNLVLGQSLQVGHKPLEIINDIVSMKVQLKNDLLTKLAFVSCDQEQVAWIESYVQKVTYEDGSTIVNLTPLPNFHSKVHKSLFLRPLKLSQLCQNIQKDGHDIKFHNGILLCNNKRVEIRKRKDKKILIKGEATEEYFYVRDMLYNSLCMI